MNYKILNDSPIKLSHLEVSTDELLLAIKNTNTKFKTISNKTKDMELDIFQVIDFRNLSGIVGEVFVKELSLINNKLHKNPSLDGYPDLLQISTPEMITFFNNCEYSHFLKFKYGGIEVKNTFGTKKAKSNIIVGDQRINNINKKLDWKAHHQQTNNLIGLFSDYIDNTPTIIALFYSDKLIKDDWQETQKPTEGSAMTSFSTIQKSGFLKMKQGLKICFDNDIYLNFFK